MGETVGLIVPQADDVTKIADIPLAVADGATNLESLSTRYRFDRRQALYYFQAAESFGLVQRRTHSYALSALGHRYVALTPAKRKEMLVRRMLSLPLLVQIVHELLISPIHRLSREQIAHMTSTRARISGTTVDRRVQSVFSWLTWLGDETEMFKVSKDYVSMMSRSLSN
jgi:hypothetical protein